ncbi:MAG: hypothetical protein J1E82_04360 [Muribaculaceae bacterium]|nr:hypothetical protein [Muribaculaceae bacterium]
MVRWWFYISMLVAGCLISCFATSCHNEKPDLPGFEEDRLYKMAINFSTVTTRDGNMKVLEKIKTFRIIITSMSSNSQEGEPDDMDGQTESKEIVQLNKLVTEESLASTFNYYLLWHTDLGTKNFYLFANEESVGNLSYSNGISEETNLKTLLNSFEPGSDASDLKSILTSAYFTPEYKEESGNIYLPYTSMYEGIEMNENYKSLEMYLVPVATKFIFNFVNYRQNPVYIDGISINSTNVNSYLFANVGENNMQMTLPNATSSLYWVDWLAKVSELSHGNYGYSQNQSFNSLYGWIWDYNLPTPEDYYSYVFPITQLEIPGFSYPDNEDGNEGEEVEGTPGKYTAGPFYVPESKVNLSLPDPDNDGRVTQKYCLTIGLKDSVTENKDVPEFNDVEIENLNALFRNTCVIINLVMRQGDVEIYAQITPWIVKKVNGWVTEGNKPNFL